MKEHNILAVGEVLFDVIEDEFKLGGAPFNVAAHMAKLGNQSFILSSVGQDELGNQIIREANELGVNTGMIYKSSANPTGTVQVEFQEGEPVYDIIQDVAWDYIITDFQELIKMEWSVVAFGSLAQRSQHNQVFYQKMFDQLTAEWIYFDCNLRQQYYSKSILEASLTFANIAKFNEHEIKIVSELLFGKLLEPKIFAEKLNSDFGILLVVYTWGKAGSISWYKGELYEEPSIEVVTKDTIGAGDAFSAGFLHSWIRGIGVAESLKYGNRLGGYVASQAGAIPVYDQQIKIYFDL